MMALKLPGYQEEKMQVLAAQMLSDTASADTAPCS
jgi:hypothetical protein